MRALPLLILLTAMWGIGRLVPGADDIDIATRFSGLSAVHPLGTDHLGRDLAARVVAGGWNALAIVALTSLLAFTLGTAMGAAITVAPAPARFVLQRLTDFVLAVPPLVLALVASAFLEPSPLAAGIALSLGGISGTTHVAHGLFEASAGAQHVRAAGALGGSPGHILRHHILPEVMPALVLVQCYHAARVLLSWSALTFLGLGGDTSRPDWGTMIWEYRLFLFDHPELPLVPACAIGLLAWAFARIGDPARAARPGSTDFAPHRSNTHA